MKLSDLEILMSDYENAKWAPDRMGVHFGCDCGCGGDSYTAEQWDEECAAADIYINKMKEFCEKYNIDYDGIERDDESIL